MSDIHIRYLAFPPSVHGVTLLESDGRYTVLLNASLPAGAQNAAHSHELAHIRLEHFYDHNCASFNEAQLEYPPCRPPRNARCPFCTNQNLPVRDRLFLLRWEQQRLNLL